MESYGNKGSPSWPFGSEIYSFIWFPLLPSSNPFTSRYMHIGKDWVFSMKLSGSMDMHEISDFMWELAQWLIHQQIFLNAVRQALWWTLGVDTGMNERWYLPSRNSRQTFSPISLPTLFLSRSPRIFMLLNPVVLLIFQMTTILPGRLHSFLSTSFTYAQRLNALLVLPHLTTYYFFSLFYCFL